MAEINTQVVAATGRVFAEYRDAHQLEEQEAWAHIDGALNAFLMERTGRIDVALQRQAPGRRLVSVIEQYGEADAVSAIERYRAGELRLPEHVEGVSDSGWVVGVEGHGYRRFGTPEGALRAFIVTPPEQRPQLFVDGQPIGELDAGRNWSPVFADLDVEKLFVSLRDAMNVQQSSPQAMVNRLNAIAQADSNSSAEQPVHWEIIDGAEGQLLEPTAPLVTEVGTSNVEEVVDSIRPVSQSVVEQEIDAIVGITSADSGRTPVTDNPVRDQSHAGGGIPDTIGRAPDASGSPSDGKDVSVPEKKTLGPKTLMNGRFERDEAGQYRREGEERIALVDEGERIRFVDKQRDTYMASIELAAAKGWKTIEVTGSPKFRADAWLNAKLAGFEVVGYTPSEQDLVTLEDARTGKGIAVSEENLMKSRAAALAVAKTKCAKVADADQEKGRYSGPLLIVTEHHAVQDIGRRTAVVHELSKLPKDEVQRALTEKRSLSVEYSPKGVVFAKAREVTAKSIGR